MTSRTNTPSLCFLTYSLRRDVWLRCRAPHTAPCLAVGCPQVGTGPGVDVQLRPGCSEAQTGLTFCLEMFCKESSCPLELSWDTWVYFMWRWMRKAFCSEALTSPGKLRPVTASCNREFPLESLHVLHLGLLSHPNILPCWGMQLSKVFFSVQYFPFCRLASFFLCHEAVFLMSPILIQWCI